MIDNQEVTVNQSESESESESNRERERERERSRPTPLPPRYKQGVDEWICIMLPFISFNCFR